MVSRLQTGRAVKGVWWVLLGVAASGCVTVYQPLVGLHRPTAVDVRRENFVDATVLVRCHPDDSVDPGELCRNLRSMLSKQGATVTTEIPRAQGRIESRFSAPPDFTIDVTSKLLAEQPAGLWWLVNIASLTLVPATSEALFSQDVTVRDAQGFLLSQENLQERFIFSFGLGIWALNGVLDLLVRPASEQVTGTVASEEFTKDFHGRVSQLLYNAQVRARVMRSFEPLPSAKPSGSRP